MTEYRHIHYEFWDKKRADRTFELCMRYFRTAYFNDLFKTPEASIDAYCPEHLHETLRTQCKLEGLI